jgi:hypothetical protein
MTQATRACVRVGAIKVLHVEIFLKNVGEGLLHACFSSKEIKISL